MNLNRISIFVLIGTALGLSSPNVAQAHNDFEVSAGLGLRLGGMGEVSQGASTGDMRMSPAFSYGAILGYRAKRDGFAFLSFSRAVSKFHFDSEQEDDVVTGNLAVEYYQLGGNLEHTSGRWVPYLGASVGVARWVSMGGGGSRVFFAAGLDGGIKYDIHEHVHLRLSGRLPITMADGEIFCPQNGDCVELTKFTPLVQAEAQLGVGVSF